MSGQILTVDYILSAQRKHAEHTGWVGPSFFSLGTFRARDGQITITAYTYQYLGGATTKIQRSENNVDWVDVISAYVSGAAIPATDTKTLHTSSTPYYYRILISTGVTGDAYSNSYEAYPSYYLPRIRGNKLRTLTPDMSAFEAPGTSKITDALLAAGRVCTYP